LYIWILSSHVNVVLVAEYKQQWKQFYQFLRFQPSWRKSVTTTDQVRLNVWWAAPQLDPETQFQQLERLR
jgi:hypothetical protein